MVVVVVPLGFSRALRFLLTFEDNWAAVTFQSMISGYVYPKVDV